MGPWATESTEKHVNAQLLQSQYQIYSMQKSVTVPFLFLISCFNHSGRTGFPLFVKSPVICISWNYCPLIMCRPVGLQLAVVGFVMLGKELERLL